MTGPRRDHRQPCPVCAATVVRLQRSAGVAAAYPCNCWLTPAQAFALRDAARLSQLTAREA